MSIVTLTPAYGRDYKSSQAVKADFESNKDFVFNNIMSPYDGKFCSKSQFSEGTILHLRYNQNRDVIVLEVKK